MRPLLRPGTHVLSRDDGHVQVGLDPRQALLLPDSPAVRDGLTRLDGSPAGDPDLVAVLSAADLVVDERALLPLLAGPTPASRHDTAALVRRLGERAPEVRERRTGSPVATVTFGPEPSGHVATLVTGLLGSAGVPVHDTADGCALGLLVGVGEPDRSLLDAWTRAGTPYALLRLTEGRARLGPFVVPGRTACLRCVDAHHTDADRAWPLLVAQYATACRTPRPDGVPEPVDPALAALAAAWVARDVLSHLDGLPPSTWSATLTLEPDLRSIEARAWERHPECACSW